MIAVHIPGFGNIEKIDEDSWEGIEKIEAFKEPLLAAFKYTDQPTDEQIDLLENFVLNIETYRTMFFEEVRSAFEENENGFFEEDPELKERLLALSLDEFAEEFTNPFVKIESEDDKSYFIFGFYESAINPDSGAAAKFVDDEIVEIADASALA
jgi:hypothetical protein